MEGSYNFLLLVLLLMLGTILVMAFIVEVWMPYQKERNYIKMEISRSSDRERKYWKRALRNLYIRHIPVIGYILAKRGRKH